MKKLEKIPFGWIALGLVGLIVLLVVTTPRDGAAHYGRLCLTIVCLCLIAAALAFWIEQIFTVDRKAWEDDRPRREAEKAIRRGAEGQKDPAVAAELLYTDEQQGSVLGTAVRGTLGYLIFGVFGAGVAVNAGWNKAKRQRATFSVKYASGRTGVETVAVGTRRFQELAALVVK